MFQLSFRIQGFTGTRVLLLRPWARVRLQTSGIVVLADGKMKRETEILKERREVLLWTLIAYPQLWATTFSAVTADSRRKQTQTPSSYSHEEKSSRTQHKWFFSTQKMWNVEFSFGMWWDGEVDYLSASFSTDNNKDWRISDATAHLLLMRNVFGLDTVYLSTQHNNTTQCQNKLKDTLRL